MKYLVANWKANKNSAEVRDWAAQFAQSKVTNPQLQIIICPSFVHLSLMAELLPQVILGTQTISPYANGAYTGAVTALMASDWAKYALLGHSERRRYFQETDQIVANQTLRALENNLTPIVAVDDHNWASQLSQFDAPDLKKILVMYEPPEAISTSTNAQPADLQKVKAALQLMKAEYQLRGTLYGGSVDATNVAQYMHEELIDGVVVGAASLDAAKFTKIVEQCL